MDDEARSRDSIHEEVSGMFREMDHTNVSSLYYVSGLSATAISSDDEKPRCVLQDCEACPYEGGCY